MIIQCTNEIETYIPVSFNYMIDITLHFSYLIYVYVESFTFVDTRQL